jgi:protease II
MPRERRRAAIAAVLPLLAVSLGAEGLPKPPVAERRDHAVVSPQGTRNDPYDWLRDDTRSRPDVLAYLRAENAYYQAMTAPYATLAESLTKEIVGRIQQDDSTVPYKKKDYLYYLRFETGKERPIFARRPVGSGREEVMVDANVEAGDRAFYSVGARAVSSDQKVVAFLEDTAGRRQYTLRFRTIATGTDYPERIHGLSSAVAWANDGRTVFYVENDPETLLSTRVKRHVLGSDPASDRVVYEETDKTFYLTVDKTGDDRYVVIQLHSTVSDEVRAIDADHPEGEAVTLAPRERDVLNDADHMPGRWVFRTNWQAPNYRMMAVADGETGDRGRWTPLLPYEKDVFVQGFALFRDHLALSVRSEGLLRIRIVPWSGPEKAYDIAADEPVYAEDLDVNAEQDADTLRYSYTSLDPEFRSPVVSLLDRGFVYAIAHVRGGQEMGREWYDDGKLQKKSHTFTDFVDVTEYLVAQGYAAPDKVFAMGGSAGGLLMGAVANLVGTKYRGIVAHVPFVDVVTTMLDESIPLTTNEFDEWGNPREKASYDAMLSYSPYDNVGARPYPAMLVTTGLYDSQVQYYEPAKWVAKLRATKTDANPLLLKVNVEAGHGGKSGRFERLREVAEEYAFILDVLGVRQ